MSSLKWKHLKILSLHPQNSLALLALENIFTRGNMFRNGRLYTGPIFILQPPAQQQFIGHLTLCHGVVGVIWCQDLQLNKTEIWCGDCVLTNLVPLEARLGGLSSRSSWVIYLDSFSDQLIQTKIGMAELLEGATVWCNY